MPRIILDATDARCMNDLDAAVTGGVLGNLVVFSRIRVTRDFYDTHLRQRALKDTKGNLFIGDEVGYDVPLEIV